MNSTVAATHCNMPAAPESVRAGKIGSRQAVKMPARVILVPTDAYSKAACLVLFKFRRKGCEKIPPGGVELLHA